MVLEPESECVLDWTEKTITLVRIRCTTQCTDAVTPQRSGSNPSCGWKKLLYVCQVSTSLKGRERSSHARQGWQICGVSWPHKMGMFHKCCQMSLRWAHMQQADLFLWRADKAAMANSPLWTYFCCLSQMVLWFLGEKSMCPDSQHGIGRNAMRSGARLYTATMKMVCCVSCAVLLQWHFLNLARNPNRRIMNQIANHFWKENKPCIEHQKIPFFFFFFFLRSGIWATHWWRLINALSFEGMTLQTQQLLPFL